MEFLLISFIVLLTLGGVLGLAFGAPLWGLAAGVVVFLFFPFLKPLFT